jgi:hypothetical protein
MLRHIPSMTCIFSTLECFFVFPLWFWSWILTKYFIDMPYLHFVYILLVQLDLIFILKLSSSSCIKWDMCLLCGSPAQLLALGSGICLFCSAEQSVSSTGPSHTVWGLQKRVTPVNGEHQFFSLAPLFNDHLNNFPVIKHSLHSIMIRFFCRESTNYKGLALSIAKYILPLGTIFFETGSHYIDQAELKLNM